MKIIWTKHAEERQKEWERKLLITREEIEILINNPQQVVKGDLDVFVVQGKTRNGLLRIPFIKFENSCKILTVYWTSKIEKYWEGKR